jgi:LPS O-antigen subunit length determinant protein (WzzB/FepE family)
MTDRVDHPKDEIELIEILQVLWKWKYLILFGTLICAGIGAGISLMMPKIYRVSMILQPAVLEISRAGKTIYIDSPENIKAMIESGSFNSSILKDLRSRVKGDIPRSLRFKVKTPSRSNVLQVVYEGSNRELNISIMENLRKAILSKYNDQTEDYRSEKDAEINLNRAMLISFEGEMQFLEENIKHMQEVIIMLRKQIKSIDINLIEQEKNKHKFSYKNDNVIFDILYTSMMQHNNSLIYLYNNEIYTYQNMIQNNRMRITKLQIEKSGLSENIKNLENEKKQIRGIEILQAPTISTLPIKPRTKLNMIVWSVIGLVVMIFLAFFVEYISRYRTRGREGSA